MTSDDAALAIPGGALARGHRGVVAEGARPCRAFVPRPLGFTALAELAVDFAGATLSLPARAVDLRASAVPPGGRFFVARVESVDGETKLQVVAWAEREAIASPRARTRISPASSRAAATSSITRHPRIAFLAGGPAPPGPARPRARDHVAAFPSWASPAADGAYTVLTLTGHVRASARVLGTALIGTAETERRVRLGAGAGHHLAQAVTMATVTPTNGATGVFVGAQVELEASDRVRSRDAIPANMRLRRVSDNAVLNVRTVLSGNAAGGSP